jgi:putative membrane protein
MNWILKFIASALAVMFLSYILPGVHIAGFGTAMVVVIILSLCNLTIKPLLIFFTLPITLVTLGLFLLVINVIIINITDFLVPGFRVDGFFNALIFSFFLSFLNSFSAKLIEKKEV